MSGEKFSYAHAPDMQHQGHFVKDLVLLAREASPQGQRIKRTCLFAYTEFSAAQVTIAVAARRFHCIQAILFGC